MATREEVINQVLSSLTTMQSNATTAIGTLTAAAAGFSATTITANPSYQAVLGAYNKFTESDGTIATAMSAFDESLSGITVGILDSTPVLSNYTSPVWDETNWSNIKNLLSDFTNNITSSDDVDSVVTKLTSETTRLQVALYAADRERKQQGLRDAFSAANAATGARGFTYPNSMTIALKLAAQQQYTFDLAQTSRELVKLIFEWAKNNYQFSIQQQVAAHTADMDFNIRYADTLIRVYSEQVRNALQKYRDEVAGAVAKAEQKIKSYGLRLESIKTNAAVDSEKDRAAVAAFSANVVEMLGLTNAAVNTAAETAKNKITAGKAVVDALGAISSVMGSIDITTRQA